MSEELKELPTQGDCREAFYKAKERLLPISNGAGAVNRFWHEQGIEQGWQAASTRLAEALGVIEEMREAMLKSVDIGCTDHLDCCDDGGDFWYRSITTAERFMKGEKI